MVTSASITRCVDERSAEDSHAHRFRHTTTRRAWLRLGGDLASVKVHRAALDEHLDKTQQPGSCAREQRLKGEPAWVVGLVVTQRVE